MIDVNIICHALTDRYGVPMTGQVRKETDGLRAEFRPEELPHTQGFSVEILIGWRTIEVNFIPASYGRPLLSAMGQAGMEKRCVFNTFVQAAINSGADVTFQVNGQSTGTSEKDDWPAEWKSLTFGFSKGPMTIDGTNPEIIDRLALEWSSRMLGSILALLPLEPVDESQVGEAEGGGIQALITRYERSRLNRQACIDFHGHTCKVCGFDFGKTYGAIGEEFIEVHHVESLARLAPGTVLNPKIDLVPLCSNCHSMVHRRSPVPYTVDELKTMIGLAAETATI